MKRRLLVLAPAFAPSYGGVEKHLIKIFPELQAHGYSIRVLVRYRATYPAHQVVNGVEVWRLPRRLSWPVLLAWCLLHPRAWWGAAVVHSHDFYLPLLRRLLAPAHWVHTFHGYEGYPLDPAAITNRRAIRATVPVCIGVGAYIETWYGTRCNYVTYGAVEPNVADPQTKPLYDFVFAGRLEEDTGIMQYLAAMAQLAPVSALVVGDGSLREAARNFAKQHNIKLTLTGWVEEVAPYIVQGKIFCAGGYLSILEGALCERPMIVFYETPIRRDAMECMPIAQDYWLAGTVEEIVAAYRSIQRPAAGRRVAKAKSWAEQQTWSALANLYCQAYEAAHDNSVLSGKQTEDIQ